MGRFATDELPYQEAILRHMASRPEGSASSIADITQAVGADRMQDVEAEVEHLVEIGLARRSQDDFELTAEGREAVTRFP